MATPKPAIQPMFEGLQGVMSKGFFRVEAHSTKFGVARPGFSKTRVSGTRGLGFKVISSAGFGNTSAIHRVSLALRLRNPENCLSPTCQALGLPGT